VKLSTVDARVAVNKRRFAPLRGKVLAAIAGGGALGFVYAGHALAQASSPSGGIGRAASRKTARPAMSAGVSPALCCAGCLRRPGCGSTKRRSPRRAATPRSTLRRRWCNSALAAESPRGREGAAAGLRATARTLDGRSGQLVHAHWRQWRSSCTPCPWVTHWKLSSARPVQAGLSSGHFGLIRQTGSMLACSAA